MDWRFEFDGHCRAKGAVVAALDHLRLATIVLVVEFAFDAFDSELLATACTVVGLQTVHADEPLVAGVVDVSFGWPRQSIFGA